MPPPPRARRRLVLGRLGLVAGERRGTRRRASGGGSPTSSTVSFGLVEAADRLHDRAAAGRDRQAHGACPSICGASSTIAAERPRGLASPRSASARWTSSRSPPTRALSSSAVPSAITMPWSMTAMRSASRSASSRYCVVSSTVVPSATSSSIVSHSVDAAARVEPGGRLVEEQHRRARDERGGEVEPAAHAARVGLGRRGRAASARSKRSSSSCAARVRGAPALGRRGGRP